MWVIGSEKLENYSTARGCMCFHHCSATRRPSWKARIWGPGVTTHIEVILGHKIKIARREGYSKYCNRVVDESREKNGKRGEWGVRRRRVTIEPGYVVANRKRGDHIAPFLTSSAVLSVANWNKALMSSKNNAVFRISVCSEAEIFQIFKKNLLGVADYGVSHLLHIINLPLFQF